MTAGLPAGELIAAMSATDAGLTLLVTAGHDLVAMPLPSYGIIAYLASAEGEELDDILRADGGRAATWIGLYDTTDALPPGTATARPDLDPLSLVEAMAAEIDDRAVQDEILISVDLVASTSSFHRRNGGETTALYDTIPLAEAAAGAPFGTVNGSLLSLAGNLIARRGEVG